MGIITKSIKWSLKLGIGAAPIYVAHTSGIFGTVDQAEKGIKQLKTDVKETIPQYVPKEVLDTVPEVPAIEIPNLKEMLPDVGAVAPDLRGFWNTGVLFSFNALANAPQAAKSYSNDLVVYIQEQMSDNNEQKK